MHNYELIFILQADLDEASLNAADIVIIATDHSNVDYWLVAGHARAVLDTRNVFGEARPRPSKVWML